MPLYVNKPSPEPVYAIYIYRGRFISRVSKGCFEGCFKGVPFILPSKYPSHTLSIPHEILTGAENMPAGTETPPEDIQKMRDLCDRGSEWTRAKIAEELDIPKKTVQTHLRGYIPSWKREKQAMMDEQKKEQEEKVAEAKKEAAEDERIAEVFESDDELEIDEIFSDTGYGGLDPLSSLITKVDDVMVQMGISEKLRKLICDTIKDVPQYQEGRGMFDFLASMKLGGTRARIITERVFGAQSQLGVQQSPGYNQQQPLNIPQQGYGQLSPYGQPPANPYGPPQQSPYGPQPPMFPPQPIYQSPREDPARVRKEYEKRLKKELQAIRDEARERDEKKKEQKDEIERRTKFTQIMQEQLDERDATIGQLQGSLLEIKEMFTKKAEEDKLADLRKEFEAREERLKAEFGNKGSENETTALLRSQVEELKSLHQDAKWEGVMKTMESKYENLLGQALGAKETEINALKAGMGDEAQVQMSDITAQGNLAVAKIESATKLGLKGLEVFAKSSGEDEEEGQWSEDEVDNVGK